ncbi:hypothetical protein J1614_007976 [Plenodomus biglobosus]|nr:hypothetical protein J1614_007976 [Plenodomus biglobosus]
MLESCALLKSTRFKSRHQSIRKRDLLSILLLGPDCGAITLPVRQQQTIQATEADDKSASSPTQPRSKTRRRHIIFRGELQNNPRSDNSAHHTAYVALLTISKQL